MIARTGKTTVVGLIFPLIKKIPKVFSPGILGEIDALIVMGYRDLYTQSHLERITPTAVIESSRKINPDAKVKVGIHAGSFAKHFPSVHKQLLSYNLPTVVTRDVLSVETRGGYKNIDYGFPGGKGEKLEPAYRSAIREIEEETGLKVNMDQAHQRVVRGRLKLNDLPTEMCWMKDGFRYVFYLIIY